MINNNNNNTCETIATEIQINKLLQIRGVVELLDSVLGQREIFQRGESLQRDVAEEIVIDGQSLQFGEMAQVHAFYQGIGCEINPIIIIVIHYYYYYSLLFMLLCY